MKALAAIAPVALLVGMTSPAATAEVWEKTTYYTVRGATLEELDRKLKRLGPLDASTGLRHPATATVRFSGTVTYARGNGMCRVATADVKLGLEFVLPQWKPARRPDARTLAIWNLVENDLRRYQAEQARIAKIWLQATESALRNLRPERSCANMEAKVARVAARYMEVHDDAQVELAERSAKQVESRLRQALRDKMRGVARQ